MVIPTNIEKLPYFNTAIENKKNNCAVNCGNSSTGFGKWPYLRKVSKMAKICGFLSLKSKPFFFMLMRQR